MTEYAVGSVASFLSQKSTPAAVAEPQKKKKKEPQKNQEVLNQLFAVSNVSAAPVIVANVPVVAQPVKKLKRNKRNTDQYKIHASNPKKKKDKTADELEDEVAEKVFDPETEQDPFDNDDEAIPSEKVARQMKKQEIKNIKKKAMEKGTTKEGDEKVVIVKNLPIKVKRRSIHHMFAKFGPIESVWLRCAALIDPAMPKKVAVIKQQFHPDRQSITAFVRFKEAESAQQALSATGTIFQEQHIAVSLLTETSNQKMSTSIFVGNLPFNIEDEALWTHFGQCGKIKDVRIIRDSNNGLGKGFGYVNFESPDAVELALRLDESELNNRTLRVTRCKKNPKPKAAAAVAAAKDKTKGAYKRVQDKQTKRDRAKSSGWISKMKQREKQSQHHQGGQVQSFAGETTSTTHKVVSTGKMIKKNKEEQRKKVIAAKLASK